MEKRIGVTTTCIRRSRITELLNSASWLFITPGKVIRRGKNSVVPRLGTKFPGIICYGRRRNEVDRNLPRRCRRDTCWNCFFVRQLHKFRNMLVNGAVRFQYSIPDFIANVYPVFGVSVFAQRSAYLLNQSWAFCMYICTYIHVRSRQQGLLAFYCFWWDEMLGFSALKTMGFT